MTNLNRYEQRRIERIKRREIKRRQRHRRNVAIGIMAAVLLLLSSNFILSKLTNNSNAMSANVIEPASEQVSGIINSEVSSDAPSIKYVTRDEYSQIELAPRTEKEQAAGFRDKLDTFLVTNKDTTLYLRTSLNSGVVAVIPKDTYVETYGHENGWTKVTTVGREGYIRDKDLDVVGDPTFFKVVDGHLIVNATYGLPTSYTTVFNEEAAAALRVMIESMGRDEVSVEVATTFRSAADEAKELVYMGNPTDAPSPGHAPFQTGFAVQLYEKGTDPRLDNAFEKSKAFAWLSEHAHEYGYILRYPKGSRAKTGYRENPMIFYYVGIEDATIIHKENLTMEDFYETGK